MRLRVELLSKTMLFIVCRVETVAVNQSVELENSWRIAWTGVVSVFFTLCVGDLQDIH